MKTVLLFLLINCFCLCKCYQTCNEKFLYEVQKNVMNMTHCKSETLGTEFAWKYDNNSRRLQFVFGAKLDDQGMVWLAWGLNPKEVQMAGTRALIGIKTENGSLAINTYNITQGTKKGCGLLPSKNDLNFKKEFIYMSQIDYYTIHATLDLPHEYNESSLNVVWQVGKRVRMDIMPRMHDKSLQNFDSTQTIDLVSGRIQTLKARSRHRLRTAHGLLNMVGWGTLLPIGVIIARYSIKFPFKSKYGFRFHVSCQILGWTVGSVGWIMGIFLGYASKYYTFPIHGTLGIFIFTFATLQMLALRLKPRGKDPYRHYWNMYHHFLGYSLLAAIVVNIFKGIRILNAEKDWRWAYIGELTFFGCIVLLLEIYTWKKFYSLKKSKATAQAAIAPTNTPPTAQPATTSTKR